MVEGIDPLHLRLAQLIGEEEPVTSTTPVTGPARGAQIELGGSPFEDILGRAVDSLEGLSRSERTANDLIDRYVKGQADLQDVMVETSKLNIMVQLAVTTINLAVTTFKEITQMQV
jgi:flagellar hook-basal body complex protein FliE